MKKNSSNTNLQNTYLLHQILRRLFLHVVRQELLGRNECSAHCCISQMIFFHRTKITTDIYIIRVFDSNNYLVLLHNFTWFKESTILIRHSHNNTRTVKFIDKRDIFAPHSLLVYNLYCNLNNHNTLQTKNLLCH